MNLVKATGTIGGLTMVSRVLGFAREMVFARIMGAGMAADAFALAFLIPNLFRRLFGEGAFSAGFVPLFSQRLNGEGGMEEARRFAEEVMAVFLPILIAITAFFMMLHARPSSGCSPRAGATIRRSSRSRSSCRGSPSPISSSSAWCRSSRACSTR